MASTWEANEFTSNGLKFLVNVTPVTASSVIDVVLVLPVDPDLPLCPLLEQAATPRPRTIAAAMPFRYLCLIALNSKLPGRFFTGQRC